MALAPESELVDAAQTAYKAATATGDAAKISAAATALKAAKTTITSADALNPVGALAKVGQAVAASSTPEATTFVGKILAGAVGQAVGSGIEGAAYGLGQSVSEQALGDPDAMGEKLVSNVGWSALLGGGLGGVIKAGKSVFLRRLMPRKML